MELGVYSFAEAVADPNTGRRISPQERLKDLVEEIELADQVGPDVEHGNQRFLMQISVGTMPHHEVMRSIELLGTRVAPIVRAGSLIAAA